MNCGERVGVGGWLVNKQWDGRKCLVWSERGSLSGGSLMLVVVHSVDVDARN